MKKNRVFGKLHSWGHANSVFNFLKFKLHYVWFIWKKKRKMISDSEDWKKKIYKQDIVITNGQVHHWSLNIKIYLIYF